jgi:hypothetical protein
MIPYVVFNTATGAITQQGYVEREKLPDVAPAGHKAIAGRATHTAHYVDLLDETICSKLPNRARPVRIAVQLGDPAALIEGVPGSLVSVRGPGGSVVSTTHLDENGGVVVWFREAGCHQVTVTHDWTFPVTWPFDVSRPA